MKSLKQKLLCLILPLCLVPLIGISVFSYFVAKEKITEDRIVLFLQQMAAEIADQIQLTLLEKMEETVSMTLHNEFVDSLEKRDAVSSADLLNKMVIVHEVYDVIVLFDAEGDIVQVNTIDRKARIGAPRLLDEQVINRLLGQNMLDYTPNSSWLQKVRSGRIGYLDRHLSPLVHKLYPYEDVDESRQYSLGFSAPVFDDRSMVIGGILALMNWDYVQEITDKVDEDLDARSLRSGDAFLVSGDNNTIIANQFRKNRTYPPSSQNEAELLPGLYNARLLEDLNLPVLRKAIVEQAFTQTFEYPKGIDKIIGLAYLSHDFFKWTCAVSLSEEDIFSSVRELRTILIAVVSLTSLLVVILTFHIARVFSVPIKDLTRSAQQLAKGNLTRRAEVRSADEIGRLARSFNFMAESLEERSQQLTSLNKNLEEKVQTRTEALEGANREMAEAYHELKETQFQLVQSEKLASLGQLVAGIAHEIKNPLNFIYGNTGFLRDYIEKLEKLVALYEEGKGLGEEEKKAVDKFKEEIGYSFIIEDLGTLVDNFEEGAERIHSIVGDLRTFSRTETGEFKEIDLHEAIDLALNLLHNEFKGRIEIVKKYGSIPQVACQAGKINQVLVNLLINAGQAIPEEGEIILTTRKAGDYVEIIVDDNGKGMKADQLEHIFEPFFTTKPVGAGTGLGLSISYAIIQDHNGSITVDSKPGKGTRFCVSLPVKHK
jgi:signal transduction histidine kinase